MTALRGGVDLLERAIGYTLGTLDAVRPDLLPELMTLPTPCRDWDLRALLDHVNDSLLALHEAAAMGRVFPDAGDYAGQPSVDPVALLRDRARRLLGAPLPRTEVTIGDFELTTAIVTTTGAFEITVHGWDIARACGMDHPIPDQLAEELLDLSALLVTGADRPSRFAAPVDPPYGATPSDRLVAFLGRQP